MSHPFRRWITVGLALVLLTVLAAAWAWRDYQQFLLTPALGGDHPVELRVRRGDSVRGVLQRLAQRGVITNDWRWRLHLWLHPVTIQAGEYRLPIAATPARLLEALSSGAVIQYRFTLVEGWSWVQLRAALQAEERLQVAATRLQTETVMEEIGSEHAHPEGWFLPETYAYTAGDDALDLLRRAHAAMQSVLADAWDQRAPDLPLDTPYQLLTLASIVEKESALHAERPEIAGVFVRRLQQNWRLETDPTVIYGLGERYDGDIRSRDLREDTPWNTYVHRGLPPTPIAMPGASAVRAAATPAQGTAMFFVADGRGGHVFSDTLEAHNRAVQDLLRRQRAANQPAPPGESGQAGADGEETS